ncbi:barstar family protein [Deltaproteobacteria bacterium OttesenSCG-928-K17]|nr:barstar family protein [Deltaproteobacteria bacterium OttesenSCG-928-K17]
MNNHNGIVFDLTQPGSAPDVFYAAVSRKVAGKGALLEELYNVLKLPGYFGFNWDALYDCLCDLHWINQHRVVIAHSILPDLFPDDLGIYLNILRDAIDFWGDDKEHSLEARFNQTDEGVVKPLLSRPVEFRGQPFDY